MRKQQATGAVFSEDPAKVYHDFFPLGGFVFPSEAAFKRVFQGFMGITSGSVEEGDYEPILSSEVTDNKEGKMHRMLPRLLGGKKQGNVYRLVVVCRSVEGLWRVRTKYSRKKKEEGDKRQ